VYILIDELKCQKQNICHLAVGLLDDSAMLMDIHLRMRCGVESLCEANPEGSHNTEGTPSDLGWR